ARHSPVHRNRIVAFDEMRLKSESAKQVRDPGVRHSRQNGGIADLISVQMKDRQNRAVRCGIQKPAGLPARREWSGFGLAIADYGGGDQLRIVEYRAECVSQ